MKSNEVSCGTCDFRIVKQKGMIVGQSIGVCKARPPAHLVEFQQEDTGQVGYSWAYPTVSEQDEPCGMHPQWKDWKKAHDHSEKVDRKHVRRIDGTQGSEGDDV